MSEIPVMERFVIERAHLQELCDALSADGYQIVGPTLRDNAIVCDELTSVDQLPAGWTDVQAAGSYRLKRRNDGALFGYNVGPHAWKRWLYPPELRLWRADRSGKDVQYLAETAQPVRRAFFGARACELHAIAIQDKIFTQGAYSDTSYRARREQILVVAVNCTQAGGTCFCVSMHTGPRATAGFDLSLTEVVADAQHYFLAEVGSPRGADILRAVTHRPASAEDIAKAEVLVADAAAQMGRSLDTTGIKELLYQNAEHPRWDEVAKRCLACTNCTLVCPTCFCSRVDDVTDLANEHAERRRKWDSCFSKSFSYIHGGSVRISTKARYRQWLTHKLAAWIDQFGTSGCVGCGRCITWCPAAIDITEEVQAIRAQPPKETSHAAT